MWGGAIEIRCYFIYFSPQRLEMRGAPNLDFHMTYRNQPAGSSAVQSIPNSAKLPLGTSTKLHIPQVSADSVNSTSAQNWRELYLRQARNSEEICVGGPRIVLYRGVLLTKFCGHEKKTQTHRSASSLDRCIHCCFCEEKTQNWRR